jgi:hypothetical protein
VLGSVGLVYACTCLPDTAVLRADACVVIRYVDDDEWVELDLPATYGSSESAAAAGGRDELQFVCDGVVVVVVVVVV